MAKLDKSRAFGEICGDASGAKFVQDGRYFDAAENLIEELSSGDDKQEVKPAAAKRAKQEVKPADMSVDGQVAAALGENSGLASE